MLLLLLLASLGASKTCTNMPCSASIDIRADVISVEKLAADVYDEGPGWALVEVSRTVYHTDKPGTTVRRYAVIGSGPLTAEADSLHAPNAHVYALNPDGPWPSRQRMYIAVLAVRRLIYLASSYSRWGRQA